MLLFAFVCATLLWTALDMYLSHRQVTRVRRYRDAVPVDFAHAVSLEEHRKAADYTVARERLARVQALVDTGLSLAWVAGGIGLLYRAVALLVPPSIGRCVVFLIAAYAVSAAIGLPLRAYRAFVLEERFGFNRITVRTFVLDRIKGAAIGLAVAVPLLYVALWVMTTFSGSWWLWTWLGLVVLMAAAPTVYVRLIAPRFNQFTPLSDGDLRLRIELLLAEAGFRASELFTMDASRRSVHGNAFFLGFGRTKRIVLFDTLLAHSSSDEVAAVVAHELGHFKHGHALFGLVEGAITSFCMLAAFGWLAKQPWLLPAFGLDVEDPALALLVCLLLASVVGPLLAPLNNWLSRRHEFQADDYARQAVGAAPMISALTGLARENASTLTPDPIYALVHYSHPPVPLRVRQLRKAACHLRPKPA